MQKEIHIEKSKFGTVCNTEVYLTFSRLAANFSEWAENFQKKWITNQPQRSSDLDDLERPNWELKENDMGHPISPKDAKNSIVFLRGLAWRSS